MKPEAKLEGHLKALQDITQFIDDLRLVMIERDLHALIRTEYAGYALMGIGWVHYRKHDLEKALVYFRKAYERDPVASNAGKVGAMLLDLGRPEEALPFLQTAAEGGPERHDRAFPENVVMKYGNLAELYFALGKTGDAVAQLTRAAQETDYSEWKAVFCLANHFAACDYREEALQLLAEALSLLVQKPASAPRYDFIRAHSDVLGSTVGTLVSFRPIAQLISDYLAFGEGLDALAWQPAPRSPNHEADDEALRVFEATAASRAAASSAVVEE